MADTDKLNIDSIIARLLEGKLESIPGCHITKQLQNCPLASSLIFLDGFNVLIA